MRQWRRVSASCHVYRRRGERFIGACVDERDRFGDDSVMVWAGIAYEVKQLIVVEGNMTAVRYRSEILRTVESLSYLN